MQEWNEMQQISTVTVRAFSLYNKNLTQENGWRTLLYDEKDIQGPNITVPGFKMYPTISKMLGSLDRDEESRSNPTDTIFMRMIICGPRMLCQSIGAANQSSLME